MSPRELIAKFYPQGEQPKRDNSPPAPAKVRRSNTTTYMPAVEAEDYMAPPSYRMRPTGGF